MDGCVLSSGSGLGALTPASSVERVDTQGPPQDGQRKARRRSCQKENNVDEATTDESIHPDDKLPERDEPEHNLDRLA
jgi:hypothetical protein